MQIAPLRVRPADIADLQAYFARLISLRRGQGPVQLTQDAVKHLESYSFPGNIQVSTPLHARPSQAQWISRGA